MKKFAIILLLVLGSFPLFSQYFQAQGFLETGENPILSGAFLKPSLTGTYTWNNYAAHAGMQLLFPFQEVPDGVERRPISGLQAGIGRGFDIKDFPLVLHLNGVINPYSDLVRESNIVLLASHTRDHFIFRLGNSSRIYSFIGDDDLGTMEGKDKRVIEYRNLVYQVVVYLNKMEKSWNAGIGVGNIDNFRVQQETNPMFLFTASASVSDHFVAHVEGWWQRAGMTNLAAEGFGWYLKFGMTWMWVAGE